MDGTVRVIQGVLIASLMKSVTDPSLVYGGFVFGIANSSNVSIPPDAMQPPERIIAKLKVSSVASSGTSTIGPNGCT